mgnify:CR=1 FL=1
MASKISFTKMHGAGNDYIYVDTLYNSIPDPETASLRWSSSHTGIGSDGLVLIGRSATEDADFTMRIFNADGSEAMMCGNASRCVGKYLYERGLTDMTTLRLLTLSGVKVLILNVTGDGCVSSVTVDMGAPALSDETLFDARRAEELPDGVFVSMGNPHYVVFVDSVDDVDMSALGPELENHSAFPSRCNIEFAEMRPDGIRVRVWERGSGITMACGTGACATAVAACATGRATRESRVIMDGGELLIKWTEDGRVLMTGPAEFVFDGEIDLPKK